MQVDAWTRKPQKRKKDAVLDHFRMETFVRDCLDWRTRPSWTCNHTIWVTAPSIAESTPVPKGRQHPPQMFHAGDQSSVVSFTNPSCRDQRNVRPGPGDHPPLRSSPSVLRNRGDPAQEPGRSVPGSHLSPQRNETAPMPIQTFCPLEDAPTSQEDPHHQATSPQLQPHTGPLRRDGTRSQEASASGDEQQSAILHGTGKQRVMFGDSGYTDRDHWTDRQENHEILTPSNSRSRTATPVKLGWTTPFDNDPPTEEYNVRESAAWTKKLAETFRRPLFENFQYLGDGKDNEDVGQEEVLPVPQSSISPTLMPMTNKQDPALAANLRGSTSDRLKLNEGYKQDMQKEDLYDDVLRVHSVDDEGSKEHELSEEVERRTKNEDAADLHSACCKEKKQVSSHAMLVDPPPDVPRGSVIPPPKKDEIWPYMVAYESCLQICIKADNSDSRYFLKDSCKHLKESFSLMPHLLGKDSAEQQSNSASLTKDQKANHEEAPSIGKATVAHPDTRPIERESDFPSPRPDEGKGMLETSYILEIAKIQDAKTKKKGLLSFGRKDSPAICTISFTSSSAGNSKPIIPGSGQCVEFNINGEMLGDILTTARRDGKSTSSARIPVPVLRESDNWVEYWASLYSPSQVLEGSVLIRIKCTQSLSSSLEKFSSFNFQSTPTSMRSLGRSKSVPSATFTSPAKKQRSTLMCPQKGYDLCLKVALRYLEFRRRRLSLHGPWSWLLGEYAGRHRISDAYCRLRYLLVIMMEATPTVDCLDLVLMELRPVLKVFDGNKLTDKEQKMLAVLNDKMHALLQICFENYNCLHEGQEKGVLEDVFLPLEDGWQKKCPAPALRCAVELFHVLNTDETGVPTKQSMKTMESQFRAAARRRARKSLKHVQQAFAKTNFSDDHHKSTIFQAYAKVCFYIIGLLQLDAHIYKQDVIPRGLELVSLAGEEYSKQLREGIGLFLQRNPPRDCNDAVVSLIHALKDFEHELHLQDVEQPKGGAKARTLLGGFVRSWVDADRTRLVERFSIERQKTSMVEYSCMVQDKPSVAPPVNEMEVEIRKVMDKYKPIVQTWPDMSVMVEAALCDIIRAVHHLLERGCAVHLPSRRGSHLHQPLQKKTGQEKPFVVHRVAGLHMNSMKQILHILPSVALEMRKWTESADRRVSIDDAGNRVEKKHEGGAQPGDLFEKLLGELRASYANSLTPIVERIHDNFSSNPSTSIKTLLAGCKGVTSDVEMSAILRPLTKKLGEALEDLSTMFVPRAYAGICRGIWDHTFKEILVYLEELDELKENRGWVKRQSCTAATEVLVSFFSEKIARGLGDEFLEKDVDLPYHVSRVRQMLAKALPTSLTHSFSVY